MSDTSHAAPAATDLTQYILDQYARLTPEEKRLVIAYVEKLSNQQNAQLPACQAR